MNMLECVDRSDARQRGRRENQRRFRRKDEIACGGDRAQNKSSDDGATLRSWVVSCMEVRVRYYEFIERTARQQTDESKKWHFS